MYRYAGNADDGSPPRRAAAFRAPVLVLVSLVAAGAALGPLADPASRASRPTPVGAGAPFTPEVAGEGLLAASLGGLRTLVADAFWLRAYVMWERKDRAACTVFARSACALAPESAYFRDGYATWLALDFPHWTVRERGGFRRVPQPEQDAIHRRDALEALAFLEKEMARDPDEPRYPELAGQIASMKLKDRALSAEYYRRCAETPSTPWHAAMHFVGMLDSDGRRAEAFAWLAGHAKRLPAGASDPAISYGAYLANTGQRESAVSWLRDYARSLPADSPSRREALAHGDRLASPER